MFFVKATAIATLAVFVLGCVYEYIAGSCDRRWHRRIGKFVQAGGTRLHVMVSGQRTQGDPVIILDGGLRTNSLAWSLVEPLLSQRYQVMRFDRAGHLGSAPGQRPRNALRNGAELAELLRVLDITPPYIYVAHSYSGFLARIFANRHASDMAGLVLVETTTLPLVKTLFGHRQRWCERQREIWFSRLGITRLRRAFVAAPAQTDGVLGKTISAFHRLSATAKDVAATQAEMDNFITNGILAEGVTGYGKLPLAIIATPKLFPEFALPTDMQLAQANAWHVQTQRDLMRLSTNSVFWLCQKSGHEVPWEEPELCVRAVDWAVWAWRNQSASDTDNFRATPGRQSGSIISSGMREACTPACSR